MLQILTITLNPSLDTTIWVDKLDLNEPVLAKREKVYPGGKAINVSRVLGALDIQSTVLGLAGENNADKLITLLENEQVTYDLIMTPGNIRENLSIVFDDRSLFKINRDGFLMTQEAFDELCYNIKVRIDGVNGDPLLLVFAGSLPKGGTRAQYLSLIKQFSAKNVRVCIDTDILTERDILKCEPFLIKPNQIELSHIAGRPLNTHNAVLEYAKSISHAVTHLLVSMGSEGLLYVGGGETYYCNAPTVEVKSTVGAGDTTLAGFIAALIGGASTKECVAYATACGTAAVMCEGTDVITKASVDRILGRVGGAN